MWLILFFWTPSGESVVLLVSLQNKPNKVKGGVLKERHTHVYLFKDTVFTLV